VLRRTRHGARPVSVEHDSSSYHNGGQLAFGPDGALYGAIDDGGYLGQVIARARTRRTLTSCSGSFCLRVAGADSKPELSAYGSRNAWRGDFFSGGCGAGVSSRRLMGVRIADSAAPALRRR
jgi:hypothetical protein